MPARRRAVWVGVLLSANRFVRVFAYGTIARLTYRFGIRRTCLVAVLGAVLSTGLYGFGEGPAVLLIARVLWGLVYAALLLITLAYAIEVRSRCLLITVRTQVIDSQVVSDDHQEVG